MKNKINHSIPAFLVALLVVFTACSDEFLKEKQDYSKVSEVVYNTYAGAQSRINDIYYRCHPLAAQAMSYQYPSSGIADDYSKCTEEYGGLSKFVDNGTIISNENIDDFFYNEAKASTSPYGFIRNCNDVIWGVTNGSLPEDQKKTLLGQVYFWRAWIYFRLVKLYGGVPIIETPQLPVIGESAANLIIPRSSTKQCIDFICRDLTTASEYLPGAWDENNWGRITSGAALALKGRVTLTYASPLFNRADNTQRWDSAYAVNKKAYETLETNGFGLAYASDPGVNAKGWAKMFAETKSPEAVMVTLYNNSELAQSLAPEFWNSWERSIRPYNTIMSGGGMTPTAQMVDMFPMSNGSRALDVNGAPINGYDPNIFFKNRDPRFYRTFGFPGVEWKFSGTPDPNLKPPYSQGTNYALWNYSWYTTTDDQTNEGKSGYGTDGLADSYRGMYIRKRSDDYGVNTNSLYIFSTSRGFSQSAAPYMEIRFAEVLLNFAESACGAGHGQEALDALRKIRMRVGYTGTCGLDDALASDRGALFGAILFERQIELAYEGKRFDDVRRWLLWDGGTRFGEVSGAPASWNLTGFNGNTCSYIGVLPLNGQRRNNMEVRVSNASIDGKAGIYSVAADSVLKTKRPAALNLNVDFKTDTLPMFKMENFYRYNLTRKNRTADESGKTIQFNPTYYFFGLKSSAQKNNSTLLQNIGWLDSQKGSMGTFDPLAE